MGPNRISGVGLVASRLLGGLPESWQVEKRKWARASRICILRHPAGDKHHSLHTLLLRSTEKETSDLVLWAGRKELYCVSTVSSTTREEQIFSGEVNILIDFISRFNNSRVFKMFARSIAQILLLAFSSGLFLPHRTARSEPGNKRAAFGQPTSGS